MRLGELVHRCKWARILLTERETLEACHYRLRILERERVARVGGDFVHYHQ